MFKETLSPSIWEWHSVPMPSEHGKAVNTFLHYGDTAEIIFTSGITGEISVNGKRIVLEGDTAVFIPPKHLHSATYVSGGNFIRVLHVNLEKLEKYVNIKNVLSAKGCPLDRIPNRCKNFKRIYENACAVADSDTPFAKKLLFTLDIMDDISEMTEKKEIAVSPESSAARLMMWTEENYSKKVTMKDASEFFGYNKNYFSKWIKETVGTGFTEFLNSVRISHACAYLSGGRTIEETAELCGYGDPSYFIKVFKKLRGMTPKSYAMKNQDTVGY